MGDDYRRVQIPFIRRRCDFIGRPGWQCLTIVLSWPPFLEWTFGGIYQ